MVYEFSIEELQEMLAYVTQKVENLQKYQRQLTLAIYSLLSPVKEVKMKIKKGALHNVH